MADTPVDTPMIIPCAVRVALHPIEALRVVSTLQQMQSDPSASSHLQEVFRGTEMARAVLTICARLDAARLENPTSRTRLMLCLADDEGADLDLKINFAPIGLKPRSLHTTPPRDTGDDDDQDADHATSSGGSHSSLPSSEGSIGADPSGHAHTPPRAPHTI